MTFILRELSLGLDEPMECLREKTAKKLGISAGELKDMRILRESLDARPGAGTAVSLCGGGKCGRYPGGGFGAPGLGTCAPVCPGTAETRQPPVRGRVVIIGFGPCGIFAALTLAKQGTSRWYWSAALHGGAGAGFSRCRRKGF